MSLDDNPIAIIQEGTAWGLQYSLTDKDDAPEVPSSINYTIHDESSASKIEEDTVVAASTFEITLDKAANTLQDRTKTEGTHILTILIEFADATDTMVIVTRWNIKRSKFLS